MRKTVGQKRSAQDRKTQDHFFNRVANRVFILTPLVYPRFGFSPLQI